MSKIPPTICPDFTLKLATTDQNMFCNFCYQTKDGDHMFPFFNLCPPHGEIVLKLRDIITDGDYVRLVRRVCSLRTPEI